MNGRDDLLGRELRSLYVPDHRPDFFVDLAQRLEQEATPDGGGRRPGGRQPPILMVLAAAAVVLAVVAVSAQLVGNDGSPIRRQPESAAPGPAPTPTSTPSILNAPAPGPMLISATEVRTRVSTALASLRSLSGEVTLECAVACPRRWSFVTTAAGDERITGIGTLDDLAYSAARRELRTVTDGGRLSAQISSNLAPGPPDFNNRSSVLRRDVASVVRAFLNTTDEVPVTEVTEGDRPAWRLVVPVVPNKAAGPGGSADQLEVLVDRQSGFPLRITETISGRLLTEIRLSNLVVDGPVDPASFTLEPPAGVEPFRQDSGFASVTLDQVEAIVGYRPLLPTAASLPPGYVLADVTVATEAGTPGNEGVNAPSPRVVSVAYRRGFDRIVVTTRSTGTAKACLPSGHITCWNDPLASGEGYFDEPREFTVAGGALAGARAQLLISPRGVPHVWTIDDRLVVTVAGDANAEELQRMAESFGSAG